MGEDLTVEVIRQLPLATVAIIACVALWRAYNSSMKDHIETLKTQNREEIGELRARLMVIEDNLHIQRSERMKYIPSLKMPTNPEIKDLD